MSIEVKSQTTTAVYVALTESAAEKLCALLGVVEGDDELEQLFQGLDKALPDRDQSFSDFFAVKDGYFNDVEFMEITRK